MKKLGAILILMCSSALAQNVTAVSAAKIQGNDQTLLANGQICFLMTDANDQPISVQGGGGGQVTKAPVCKTVTNGGITTFNILSTTATSPANVGYRITVKDTNTQTIVILDKLVSISGATFNFDNYTPTVGAVLAPLSGTSVAGNLSVTGNVSATGTVTGSNIPSNILQQLQNSGTNVAQRTIANFQGGLKAVDNGSTRTDVSLSIPIAVNTVTFSATPVFDLSLGSVQKLTLTGNVTSSTVSNGTAGGSYSFEICQDATGGRTFVPPTGLNQWAAIPSTALACSAQQYYFDTTTNAYPDMMPALSGDVTTPANSTVATLANSGVVAGTCGMVTVDVKGRATVCTTLEDGTHGGTGVSSTAVYPTSGNISTDANVQTQTNKTYDTAGTGNVFKIAGTTVTGKSGNTGTVATTTGAFTSGNCVNTDAGHNFQDAGFACDAFKMLDKQDQVAGINGNSADQTIYTYSMPASTIASGQCIAVEGWQHRSVGAGTLTIKLFFGATTLINTTSTQATPIRLFSKICNNAGSTTAQWAVGEFMSAGPGFVTLGTSPAETTASGSIVIKMTFNVATGTSAAGDGWTVMRMPK
jgi:hypothetical protein